MPNLKYFQGTLTLSDADKDMNRMNYGLTDLITGEFRSISDELERIYNSNCKIVRISIKKFNEDFSLCRMGSLHKKLNKNKIEIWFIGQFPFEEELDEFNKNGAINMGIYIEDFILKNNADDYKNNKDGFTTVTSRDDTGGTTGDVYNDASQIS
jgi:hypothetical protein